jgi:hypothetical protein
MCIRQSQRNAANHARLQLRFEYNLGYDNSYLKEHYQRKKCGEHFFQHLFLFNYETCPFHNYVLRACICYGAYC